MRPIFVVWIVLVIVAGGVAFLALTGRSDDCVTGSTLLRARLLDEAVARLDRGACADAVGRADAARATAAASFSQARIYLAAGEQARADAKAAAADVTAAKAVQKDKSASKSAKGKALEANAKAVRAGKDADARATSADRYAAYALVAGLAKDPFRDDQGEPLSATVGRLKDSPDTVCALARRMVAAGLLAQAEPAIGLVTLPDRACEDARVAAQQQRADAGGDRRAAESARATGHDGTALGHDADALAADTSLTASMTSLTAAGKDHDSALEDAAHWVSGVPGWLTNAWEPLLVIAVALAILAVLGFRLLRRLAFRHVWLRNWLAPEKNPGRVGSRIARLRVRVSDFTGGTDDSLSAKDATALVGEALQSRPLARFPFDFVPAGQGDEGMLTRFTDVLKEAPHGALVSALLKLFAGWFGQRTAVIDGRLLPASGGGVGIGLTLVASGGRVVADEVIRDGLIDPVPSGEPGERWGRLMRPAGAWIRQEVRPLLGREMTPEHPDTWRAEALVEAARQWAAARDWPRATTCYVRALECDAHLLPALNNLAVIEIRQGRSQAALDHVELLTALIDVPSRTTWPALGEAAAYNRTLALMYLDRHGEARTAGLALSVHLLDHLDCSHERTEERRRLEAAELPSLLLFAGLLLDLDSQAQALLAALADDAPLSLAAPHGCLERRALLSLLSPKPHGAPLPATAASELVAYARGKRDAPPRARYNLACLYAVLMEKVPKGQPDRLARCRELALAELELALEDAELVPWAREDPSLAGLRHAVPSRWNDIIDRHTPKVG